MFAHCRIYSGSDTDCWAVCTFNYITPLRNDVAAHCLYASAWSKVYACCVFNVQNEMKTFVNGVATTSSRRGPQRLYHLWNMGRPFRGIWRIVIQTNLRWNKIILFLCHWQRQQLSSYSKAFLNILVQERSSTVICIFVSQHSGHCCKCRKKLLILKFITGTFFGWQWQASEIILTELTEQILPGLLIMMPWLPSCWDQSS